MSDGRRYHLRGVWLPEGGGLRDLWVADGTLSLHPLEGCAELGDRPGYLMPGLVDCHVHASWADARQPACTPQERIATARDLFTRQGTLLVRDMGAADDGLFELALRDDGLARVVPCGTMLLPYDEPPFTRTAPGELVAAVRARVAGGAGWIKLFADFSHDYGGALDTGFTGSDRVSYPLDELREAVRIAHAAGARVAAHAFGFAGAQVAIEAGVDSLEHGWGVTPELLPRMRDQGVAWAPLLSIARAMRWGARQAGDAERVAWIDACRAGLATLLPRALELGVVVLAGTDWGPGIPVAREVQALHACGLSVTQALAAASSAARDFLGAPGLIHGAPADVLFFAQDPRDDLERLLQPDLILCGGQRVTRPAPTPPPAPPDGTDGPVADR